VTPTSDLTLASLEKDTMANQTNNYCPDLAGREQQLRDIATSGDTDAAECASSDAFKEFPGKESI